MTEECNMLVRMRADAEKQRMEKKILGEEIRIPTREGQVRCLIYKPLKRTPPSPIFFNVHGGGFVMGSPEDDDFMCGIFRDALDIAIINIEYRLAPEFKCPKDKEDVYDVVKYVASHAKDFGIDPDRMAIGGHSAGANISAVVCMMAKKSKEFSFRCQVLDYPPLDIYTDPFRKFYTEGAIPPQMAVMFNAAYCEKPEDMKAVYCSPIYAGDEDLKGLPPAVILTCEIDSLREEGEEYGKKLAQAGVEVTMKRFLGVPHGFTSNPDLPQAAAGHRMIMEGLQKHLELYPENRFRH